MINEPTVLILGAGASIPYGYPSGLQLKEDIISYTKECHYRKGRIPNLKSFQTNARFRGELRNEFFSNDTFSILCEDAGIPEHDFISLHNGLKFSPYYSIDRYLEKNPQFQNIGKLAIIFSLFKFEAYKNFFEFDFKANWYRFVVNKLLEETNSVNDLINNKFKIITFNYDRSFEAYLISSLQSAYSISTTEAEKQAQNIEIIHVHGKLADLPGEYNSSKVYKYGTYPYTGMEMLELIKNIKIITEADKQVEEFEKAKFILNESKYIYFLGFGYDRINLHRLGFNKLSYSYKRIMGSGFSLTENQKELIMSEFSINLIDNIFADNLDFLLTNAHFAY